MVREWETVGYTSYVIVQPSTGVNAARFQKTINNYGWILITNQKIRNVQMLLAAVLFTPKNLR